MAARPNRQTAIFFSLLGLGGSVGTLSVVVNHELHMRAPHQASGLQHPLGLKEPLTAPKQAAPQPGQSAESKSE